MHENEKNRITIPKPVFVRLLMLFGGGALCLLVGIIVALALRDFLLLGLSGILCAAFVAKGVLLQHKIRTGKIYAVTGVCVGIAPKILGRYKRIELVDTDTGDDAFFVLPKKVVFKIGHVYTCYFDNDIKTRMPADDQPSNSFFNNGMDLPTNGFLGLECFGLYQEKKVAVPAKSAEKPAENSANGEMATAQSTEDSVAQTTEQVEVVQVAEVADQTTDQPADPTTEQTADQTENKEDSNETANK